MPVAPASVSRQRSWARSGPIDFALAQIGFRWAPTTVTSVKQILRVRQQAGFWANTMIEEQSPEESAPPHLSKVPQEKKPFSVLPRAGKRVAGWNWQGCRIWIHDLKPSHQTIFRLRWTLTYSINWLDFSPAEIPVRLSYKPQQMRHSLLYYNLKTYRQENIPFYDQWSKECLIVPVVWVNWYSHAHLGGNLLVGQVLRAFFTWMEQNE